MPRSSPVLVLAVAVVGSFACHAGRAIDDESPVELRQAAITLPSGLVEETVVTGLVGPTAMAFAPDGRLFVTEQRGQLRIIANGALLSTPALSLSVDSAGERGLLGVAFDPQFTSNGFVYLYYTTRTPAVHNRLSRFVASGNVLSAASETVLLELDNLSSATNHNGGAVHFGSDGKLYVAVGDNANGANAQTLGNLHGKMLRLDADGTIPTDNPFFAAATGNRRAIWALGLRNPFTFAVHPRTGALFINDVGQDRWEEINQGVGGANYGWPTTEGPTTDARFRGPVHAYGHGGTSTTGCAITGGAFYEPATPALGTAYVGKYFFADYCSDWIRVFDPANGSASGFATATTPAPVDLQVGPDGALYYAARDGGRIARIRANTTGAAPTITNQPQPQTRAAGQTATFAVTATGTAPLSYEWQRNGVAISGANGASYTTPALSTADDGALYRAIVRNAFGTATSLEARLTVLANAAPSATITAPVTGATYAGGTSISYAGQATDAEDGALPGSAFTWEVVFHHADHTHPFVPPTSGAISGSFVIPDRGETATDVFYRIRLTVRDSAGLETTVFRDVVPQIANLTLTTSPAGLQVTLDGQPVTTPVTVSTVVGIVRSVGAVSPQVASGTNWTWSSWSDGGTATHDVTVPAAGLSLEARYANSGTAAGLRGEYFDNRDFTASRLVRTDASVAFDWGTGAPAATMGADTFSVRWTGSVTPRFSETYTFFTTSDDGVRLWVDGTLLVNNWTDHGATDNAGSIALVAGRAYDIKLEYYENGGLAVAKLAWSSPSQPRQIVPQSQLAPTRPGGLKGEYFDNRDFTNLRVTRVDGQVGFDWGNGSPDVRIGPEDYSVRWTGRVTAPTTERYTFTTTSDDGVRLWVGGQIVVDNWTDHAPTDNSGQIDLVAGASYDVRMEFYERGGGAVAKLAWSTPTRPRALVPASALSPP